MTYGDICSGISAATVAWKPLGMRPAFFAEIDPAACAVLKHHHPAVPNAGDFTQIREGDYEAIDILVGGTPCQDFSVAGLRAGMDGARGQLTVEFARLAGRLRPRWLVWENVPGVLSSDGGRAFGTFLGMLGELGYGFAYRVLDAQYLGVPQRRRRVFVVGYLGDWRCAAAVLFERESLSGHPPPRRATGQDFTHDIAAGLTASGRGFKSTGDTRGQDCLVQSAYWDGGQTADTLDASNASKQQIMPEKQRFQAVVTHSLRADGFDASKDGTGRGTPLVPVGITIHGSDGTVSVASYTEIAGALRARTPRGAENSCTTAVLALTCKDHDADAGAMSPTLRSMGHDRSHANAGGQVAVVFVPETACTMTSGGKGERGRLDPLNTDLVAFTQNQAGDVLTGEAMHSLGTNGNATGRNAANIAAGMAVRRLTPKECERLMGFPDGYTLVPHRGKPMADGPRYKLLGNSIAVPCLRWIGERILEVDALRGGDAG